MSRWIEQASQRLRDGEEIAESITFGANGVVVTNQRLLAFTPNGDGANYRDVELPNVEDAALKSSGNTAWLEYVGKSGLAAVAGGVAGYTMDFGGLVSTKQINPQAASKTGVGSLMGLLHSISHFLTMLDDILLVVGLLALGLCLGAFGLYLESRTHGLRVTVAGAEDLFVQAPKDTTVELRRLQRHIDTQPEPTVGSSSDRDPSGTKERDRPSQDDPLRPRPE